MTPLSETQSRILSRAIARPGNLAMPLPDGLYGAAAKTVVTKMIGRGWLEEVEANLRQKEPIWRETGDGHGTTLIATAAGLESLGTDPVVIRTMRAIRDQRDREPVSQTPIPRSGTKQAALIAMLQAPEGASIAEIAEAIGWEAHSIRGTISGTLKKKLGLNIISGKTASRGRIYKIMEAV